MYIFRIGYLARQSCDVYHSLNKVEVYTLSISISKFLLHLPAVCRLKHIHIHTRTIYVKVSYFGSIIICDLCVVKLHVKTLCIVCVFRVGEIMFVVRNVIKDNCNLSLSVCLFFLVGYCERIFPKMPKGDENLYSVVFSIESAKSKNLTIHAVPSHWVQSNVLYYPPNVLGKTVIDGMIKGGRYISVDHDTWKKYACMVKKTFRSLELATAYANKKEEQVDTGSDADDAVLKHLQKLQKKVLGVNKKGSKCKCYFKFSCNDANGD